MKSYANFFFFFLRKGENKCFFNFKTYYQKIEKKISEIRKN